MDKIFYSIECRIPYNGGFATESKTFRPDSLVYVTSIKDTEVTVTSDADFTGVTVLTTNEKGNINNNYLQFPEPDMALEPFSLPGLFKLCLRVHKIVVAITTPPVDVRNVSAKVVLLKNMIRKTKLPSQLAACILSDENYHLNKLGQHQCVQQKNKNKSFRSCIEMARKHDNIEICLQCRGKLAKLKEYLCKHETCDHSVFIEIDGSTNSIFCKKHATDDKF